MIIHYVVHEKAQTIWGLLRIMESNPWVHVLQVENLILIYLVIWIYVYLWYILWLKCYDSLLRAACRFWIYFINFPLASYHRYILYNTLVLIILDIPEKWGQMYWKVVGCHWNTNYSKVLKYYHWHTYSYVTHTPSSVELGPLLPFHPLTIIGHVISLLPRPPRGFNELNLNQIFSSFISSIQYIGFFSLKDEDFFPLQIWIVVFRRFQLCKEYKWGEERDTEKCGIYQGRSS